MNIEETFKPIIDLISDEVFLDEILKFQLAIDTVHLNYIAGRLLLEYIPKCTTGWDDDKKLYYCQNEDIIWFDSVRGLAVIFCVYETLLKRKNNDKT